MTKGMTGKVMTLVISLIVAIAALTLLWLFLSNSMGYISLMVEKITTGIKCWFCEKIHLPIGFCSEC